MISLKGKKQECKRPQPKKRKMNELTFYEPPQPQLNCLTLSSITKILFEYQGNSQINVNDLAEQYKVSKESLSKLKLINSNCFLFCNIFFNLKRRIRVIN